MPGCHVTDHQMRLFMQHRQTDTAATLPVLQALVGEVAACFADNGSARQQLSRAILVLLKAYHRDGVIIQLFSQYRSSQVDAVVPDLLKDLDACLVSFFERWLCENENASTTPPSCKRR